MSRTRNRAKGLGGYFVVVIKAERNRRMSFRVLVYLFILFPGRSLAFCENDSHRISLIRGQNVASNNGGI